MNDLEIIEEEQEIAFEPFEVKYSLVNPPPEDRCNALSFNCRHPDCDYRFAEDDRETPICPICNTHRKVCGSYPAKGRNRCRLHGGATNQGLMNPNYRGKSISKHLPLRFAQMVNLDSRDNRVSLLEFTDDIELLDLRKVDLLQRVDQRKSRDLWKNMNEQMRNYRKSQRDFTNTQNPGHFRKMELALDEIEKLMARGAGDYHIWDELARIMEAQRKLRESEIKRRKDAENVVTEQQIKEMIANILNIINSRIKDIDLKKEILNDLQFMMAGQ